MAQFVIENSGSLQDTHEQVIYWLLFRSFFENNFTGLENPWEPVQVLLPLESEVTLGSGHWGALWDRLPCLKKGEHFQYGTNMTHIY